MDRAEAAAATEELAPLGALRQTRERDRDRLVRIGEAQIQRAGGVDIELRERGAQLHRGEDAVAGDHVVEQHHESEITVGVASGAGLDDIGAHAIVIGARGSGLRAEFGSEIDVLLVDSVEVRVLTVLSDPHVKQRHPEP